MTEKPFLPNEAVLDLIAMGMPRETAIYLKTTRGNSRWGYGILCTLMICLMVGGMLLPIVIWLQAPVAQWLVQLGQVPPEAFLIDLQLWSVGGLMFAGMFWGFAIFNLMLLTNRGLAIRSAISGIQQSMMTAKNQAASRWMVHRMIRRLDPALPRDEYLIAYHWASIRAMLLVAVPLTLVTLPVMAWEALSVSYAMPDGISAASMFSSRRFVPWVDVEGLSTGSYQEKSTRRLRYIVQLKNAPSKDLANWKTMAGSADNLACLARIDVELRKRAVPWTKVIYTFGIYEGQQQWDDDCFESFRAELSPADWLTFRRVYRLPP